MSIQAVKWAYDQKQVRSSAKFVLVVMADYTNEQALFYGSYARLAAATNLNRKTVIDALKYLEQRGYITDTLQRTGRTSSIKVYQLELNGPVPEGSGQPAPDAGTETQVIPKAGPLNGSESSPESGTPTEGKQSRFYVEAVPLLRGSSPKSGTQSKTNNNQEEKLDRHTRESDVEPEHPAAPQNPTDETQCQVGDVTQILVDAGLALSWLTKPDAMEVQRDMVAMGITHGELREAVTKARAAKGAAPFGIFYLRPIVGEIVSRRNGYAQDRGNGKTTTQHGSNVLANWLAEDQPEDPEPEVES